MEVLDTRSSNTDANDDDRDRSAQVFRRRDLRTTCAMLAHHFAQTPPHGYVVGKTHIRDVAAQKLGLPIVQAERLVDRLEACGAVVYTGRRTGVDDGSGRWRFDPSAARVGVP